METVRELKDFARFQKQVISNESVLLASRMLLVFDCAPAAIVQTVALLSDEDKLPSNLSYISLGSIVALVGVLVTFSDREHDIKLSERDAQSVLVGYVPRDLLPNVVQMLASTFGMASYSASRIFSLGLLFTAALESSAATLAAPILWVALECLVFAAVRIWDGSYHVYAKKLNTPPLRAILNITHYM